MADVVNRKEWPLRALLRLQGYEYQYIPLEGGFSEPGHKGDHMLPSNEYWYRWTGTGAAYRKIFIAGDSVTRGQILGFPLWTCSICYRRCDWTWRAMRSAAPGQAFLAQLVRKEY